MEDKDLQLNFVDYCFDDFQKNDATKDQYKTPQGSKDTSPNGNESESIEVVETPSNTYRGPLQESTVSSASTNNTDICVLDSHFASDDLHFLPNQEDNDQIDNSDYDEFVESEDGDVVFLRAVDVVDKNEDFTVLHKPTESNRLCSCEESTEVLMFINSEYQDSCKPAYSGTDSDVEVLMSDEVIESDWSSGNGLQDDGPKAPSVEKLASSYKTDSPHTDDSLNSPSGLQEQSCECNSLKSQTSTDFDISAEELLDANSPNDKYQNLNRKQLLQIIQKQELCIQDLEATIERYKKTEQRLLEDVNALNLELSELYIKSLKHLDKM